LSDPENPRSKNLVCSRDTLNFRESALMAIFSIPSLTCRI
jgi:hypothetical protein